MQVSTDLKVQSCKAACTVLASTPGLFAAGRLGALSAAFTLALP